MKYQYNPLLTEGYKLKTFLLDPSAGNISREAANTEKILAKYPTANDLIAGLQQLLKDPRCNSRAVKVFNKAIKKLQDPEYQNPAIYKEFVRKNLSGASGFWKYLLMGLTVGSISALAGALNVILPGAGLGFVLPVEGYRIYKVHRVEDQLNDQNADDAMIAMNRRTMFR